MKTALACLLFTTALSICGCSHPPTTQQIAGTWESTDKNYALDLCKDGTFTFTTASLRPTSMADMVQKIAFVLIAPSGTWQLNGAKIDLVPVAKGIPMQLKIVSWSDTALELQLGDADAVSFVRKNANEANRTP